MGRTFACALAIACAAGTPALADGPVPMPSGPAAAVAVPVYPGDISDRAYEVVGEITAEVRRGTLFSENADEAKIYRELWERGRKLNADAVINARYGAARVTMFSWGSVKATGTAIRFKPAEPPR